MENYKDMKYISSISKCVMIISLLGICQHTNSKAFRAFDNSKDTGAIKQSKMALLEKSTKHKISNSSLSGLLRSSSKLDPKPPVGGDPLPPDSSYIGGGDPLPPDSSYIDTVHVGIQDDIIIFPKPLDEPVAILPSSNSLYSVGTPKGNFVVSNVGAAQYNINIDVPQDGSFIPQIGLGYDSQFTGYGIAGYGFNVTGISVITRGRKDLFHDGKHKGITYTTDDNLFLDGKRLILQSGTAGQEGAVYTLEGNPYTKVVVHGVYNDNETTTWFEVYTNDGSIYQYGNTASSRNTYINKKGYKRIAAWYINRAEDKYTNFIVYEYDVSNLCVRPLCIKYGMNRTKDRGIVNAIYFNYESLGDSRRPFMIEDRAGKNDMYLSNIITSCNGQLYRKYDFFYNQNSDQCQWRTFRLIKIEEKNAEGKQLKPICINWNYLSDEIKKYNLSVDVKDNRPYIEETDRRFLSVDLNGDGVSDIVRVSPVKIIDFSGYGSTYFHYETYIYVSRSQINNKGEVFYLSPQIFYMPASFSMQDLESILGGISTMDFDGDGYNDLLIPQYNHVGDSRYESFYILFGSDVVADKVGIIKNFSIQLLATDKTPLFTPLDTEGNGKSDVVYVEDKKTDGYYSGAAIQFKGGTKLNKVDLKFNLPKDPQKLFTGDFNNDGLLDIIFLYDGGYTIYYNNGGENVASVFSESNRKEGTGLSDCWRIQQGDFDGDGLIDFIYNITHQYCLWIAHNNGDGTFSYTRTEDLGIADHDSNGDDDKFSIMVWDMDHDGRSDVMVCKAGYEYHGFPKFKNTFTDTRIKWLRSTGTNLNLFKEYVKYRQEDAFESTIFLGDFNGDGSIELANYGGSLNCTGNDFEDKINVYQTGTDQSKGGRISSITDGLGKSIHIIYESATRPSVYTPMDSGRYPVNTYTLPIPVVSCVNINNGAAGNYNINYKYAGLKVHVAGRGILGFTSVTTENTTLGKKDVTSITKWDEKYWIPIEIKVISTMGGSCSTVSSSITRADVGKDNYFAYISTAQTVDLDGNKTTTIRHYDTEKGVVIDEMVKTDGDNMYKMISYSDFLNKKGIWLPTTLTMTQKHKDDSTPYTSVTTYSYDNKGNVLSTTINSGTPLALRTESTYDSYGNILSSLSTGFGVKPITTYNEYDVTGRFVIKTYTSPETFVRTFTYDRWGHVLTDSYVRNPEDILTTQYIYDGWGDKIGMIEPDGTCTTYRKDWGTKNDKTYYIQVSAENQPWVRTWYDNSGNEVLVETVGVNGLPITKATTYNNRGQVKSVKNTRGRLDVTETFEYDKRGRILKDELSSGTSTLYSYGNRSVTSVIEGRSYTKTIDSWGNILTASDPLGEVNYTYSSNGKPIVVKTHGAKVTMEYDEVGNQISLIDPDAGASTYTYAADGKLLKETNAREIETVNTYDEQARLISTNIGNTLIVNTYGTSGNEKGLLIKKTIGKENFVEYAYDKYGRITTEKRTIGNKGTCCFGYNYNNKNQLSSISYPGGLNIAYLYDKYGFKTETTANGESIYCLMGNDGLRSSTSFKSLYLLRAFNCAGFEIGRKLVHYGAPTIKIPVRGTHSISMDAVPLFKKTLLETFDTNYQTSTGNLISRKWNDSIPESFTYDDLDRLISVKRGDTETMKISYANNGNIIYKTGVGNYGYNEIVKPHAVAHIEIENDAGGTYPSPLYTSFNDFGKIDTITDDSLNNQMTFSYGPDLQRWYSVLSNHKKEVRTVLYAGDYEQITENGIIKEFYYLDGNVIMIKQDGQFKPYLAFTDNLGSILSVYDEEDRKVFDAFYDAWGKQTVTQNDIGLHRGYTGHEMLNEFNIINMNGRF